MIRIAVLAFLVAAASPALAADGEDDPGLQIDSGRLGVMMNQAEGAYATLVTQHHLAPPDANLDDPRAYRASIYDNLVFAVLDYNRVSYNACRVRAVDKALCLGPYLPPWLAQNRDYSGAELRAMTDDATGRVMPFWSALCEKVQGGSYEQPVCPME